MSHDTTTPSARALGPAAFLPSSDRSWSAPAEAGELAARIEALAARCLAPPQHGATRFVSAARASSAGTRRPGTSRIRSRALGAQVPKHAGTHPSVTVEVAEAIRTLRKQHPRWSYRLVHDNLVALGRERPELAYCPATRRCRAS